MVQPPPPPEGKAAPKNAGTAAPRAQQGPPPLPMGPPPLPSQRAGTAAPPPLPHQGAATGIPQPPARGFEPVKAEKSPLDDLPRLGGSQPPYMYGESPRKSVLSTVGRVAVPIAKAPDAESLDDFTDHLVDFDDAETQIYSGSYERISVSDLVREPERGSIVVSQREVQEAMRRSRLSYAFEAGMIAAEKKLNALASRAEGFLRAELYPEIDDVVHATGKAFERHVEPHLNGIAAKLQKVFGKA